MNDRRTLRTASLERAVINSRKADGVNEWIKALKVTKQELVAAVSVVGNSANRVRAYIENIRFEQEQRAARLGRSTTRAAPSRGRKKVASSGGFSAQPKL